MILRGRHVFMDSLVAHGVEKIFGNPGTTESPLIDSLADYPQLQYITALHEGVAVGAASHYAQASGKTAAVSLHAAPGLGNGIGMMYGALKANSPIIVTAGQQDTRMRLGEPALGHDLVAMAAPVTKWSVQPESADEIAHIMRRAWKIANDAPAGPVFIGLPIDVLEQETDVAATAPSRLFANTRPDPEGIAAIAAMLAKTRRPVIIAGDDVGRSRAQDELVALAEAIGAEVWHELLHMHAPLPGRHASARGPLPADAAGIRKALADADAVLLVGGVFFEDVWYAAGSPFPDAALVAQVEESPVLLAHKQAIDIGLIGHLPVALAMLRDAVGEIPEAADRNAQLRARKDADNAAQRDRAARGWDRRPASMARVMAEIAQVMPPDIIVVDESITASIDLARSLPISGTGGYYGARGGGIGQGLAGALGVKIAQPDRPVLAISGDGSAMYSIQSLWTAAHHDLHIVYVILANREYRVLKHNLDFYRQRFEAGSNHPYAAMDLNGPALDFVHLAQGMGVSAVRVEDPDALGDALRRAFDSGKPYLIELAVEGKP
ncbi:MAG: thiamine pyrophosphate-binding protein [Proteobacteria bacterium]|nr:thiamine pyrophosphate-binding protein [Pseudomonadota bacterium]